MEELCNLPSLWNTPCNTPGNQLQGQMIAVNQYHDSPNLVYFYLSRQLSFCVSFCVCVCVCVLTLSRLNRMTYDLDFWYESCP